MTKAQITLLLAYPVAMGIGQALFKAASIRTAAAPTLVGKAAEPTLIAALALYAALAFVWIAILKTVPLTAAYPFVALSFVVTPALAMLCFEERVSPAYAAGIALICCGVILTQRGVHAG